MIYKQEWRKYIENEGEREGREREKGKGGGTERRTTSRMNGNFINSHDTGTLV